MTGPTSEGSVKNKEIIDELYAGEAEILAIDAKVEKDNRLKTGNSGKKAPEVEIGNIKDISFNDGVVTLPDDYAKERYTTKLERDKKNLTELKRLLETKSGERRADFIKALISMLEKEIEETKTKLDNLELNRTDTER